MKYTIKGSDYGVAAGNFIIDLPEIVDNIPLYSDDGRGNFPRNAAEKQMLDSIIGQFQEQQSIVQGNTTAEGGVEAMTQKEQQKLKLTQFNDMLQQDPLRAMLNLKEAQAEKSAFKYSGDVIEELGNFANLMTLGLLPTGSGLDFSPRALGEAYKNLLVKSSPDDPKRLMGDMSVIASDLFLVGLSLGNIKMNKARMNIPLFTNEARRQGLTGYLNANPGKSTVAVNLLARAGSDATYDLLNQTYRWLNDIPAAESDDATVENILNIRNEALWSGGAVGIAKLFPYIKPFIGRNFLGVDDNAKRLATNGRLHNIPMSTFNVSSSGFVNALPPVVGLFPIVASNARLAQNAQLAAAYEQMIKSLEEFSPVTLFNDAGILIDKGFRDMVSQYGVMKGTLYNNVKKYAESLNGEAFIPTNKLKVMAAAMRGERSAGQIGIETRTIPDDPGGWSQSNRISFDELMKNVSGAGDDIELALMQLDGMPDHLNAQQFKRLVEKLNSVKKNLPALKLSENSDEALVVNDFHAKALQAMNDTKSWKKMEGEQAKLAQEWADSYTVANDFIFQNADSLQGRTAMLLKQTDPNIAIPGGVRRPGYLYADQMAKIFFDDQTIASPMALKEMRKAFGDDAFKAATRSYFDDIINTNTRFVSGKMKIQSVNAGIWNKSLSYLKGTDPEAAMKTQTITYNIPVMDIEKIADAFAIDRKNRAAGVLEMYKAIGTGSDATRTKFAEEQLSKVQDIVELARRVEVPNYGDVSTFVKRRGILGGLGSIANLFTGGAILSSPISSAGIMLMGRFGMNALSDPRFLDGMVKVLDASLSDTARKSALVTIGRGVFDPERAVNAGYDINDINDIIELIVTGDMEQSPAFNTRAQEEYEEQSAVPEAIRGERQYNTETAQAETGFDMPPSNYEPLDLSVFDEQMQVSDSSPNVRLNEDQRIALAGGNLDQAIALRGKGTGLDSLRRV